MRYDKTSSGWGRGDAVWACDAKRGNCTDFHSPFIGMLRVDGIPAGFDIGFPLPENKDKGDIAGYQCWAEFYARKTGWIPVDHLRGVESEAERNALVAIERSRLLIGPKRACGKFWEDAWQTGNRARI